MKRFAAAIAMLALAACGGETPPSSDKSSVAPSAAAVEAAEPVDAVAEAFVKLGLELGTYDPDYVDAYQGPAAWRAAAEAEPRSLEALKAAADALLADLSAAGAGEGIESARRQSLRRQIVAAKTRIRMALGETLPFDEETRLLYDAVAPQYDVADFDAALEELEQLVPGDGALSGRVASFRESLAIPTDKLSAVFDAAIGECRRRTVEHYDLPAEENFTLSYVMDKPWSGYNWYQGDYVSLIEINTDLPIIIDRAVDLGCHEGYPGHHTWNVLIERDLLGGRGWIEYAIQPLFSPQALIGEGTANYGIELAFPDGEKLAFEKEVLFPLAGLDPAAADRLAAINEARRALSHARNHIARAYLDGRIDRNAAIDMTQKYSLVTRARAEKSVDFIEHYRGYVLNYNLGRDLVKAFIEMQAAEGADPWRAFEDLLTTPISASGLEAAADARGE